MTALPNRFSFILVVVLGCLFPVSAFANNVSKLGFDGGPETLTVGDLTIQKNGSGIRSKSFLALYEGTLYLAQRSRDANQIVTADSPMAIRLQIKSGFVSQQKMLAALDQGFKNATNGNTAAIDAEIASFRKCFGDPIKKGDVFIIAYLPTSGVSVFKNGQSKGSVEGIEFKKALFGIWLSPNPVDAKLKSALLGR